MQAIQSADFPGRSLFLFAGILGLLTGLAGCGAHRSASHAPAYPVGKGPVVLWDFGHYNHGPMRSVEELRAWVSQDGYVVRRFGGQFDEAILSKADIVVIRMALAAVNDTRGLEQAIASKWVLPTPSAYSPSEIDTLVSWVRAGGALLLISDHMPFGGAVADLASAFGIEISNAFAVDATAMTAQLSESVDAAGIFMFRRADGTLSSHPVTDGRSDTERIDLVATDGGCAFRLPPGGKSLLTLAPSAIALLPEVAWEFHGGTPRRNIGGWSQGGVMHFGRGRVAVFCDAFPIWGPLPIPPDWEDRHGIQHAQFTLNLFHWLSGELPDQ
jgi:hypothetical protein